MSGLGLPAVTCFMVSIAGLLVVAFVYITLITSVNMMVMAKPKQRPSSMIK